MGDDGPYAMGWYQTVLRAKDTKPVTVPNGYFLGHNVINISRQTHRVLILDFRVRYEDRDKIFDIIADFEAYLTANDEIDPVNHPVRVNVTANNPDHLVLNVEAHARKVDLTEHYKVKTRILMALMDLMEKRTGYAGALPTTGVRLLNNAVEGEPEASSRVWGAKEDGHAGETIEAEKASATIGFSNVIS